MPGSERNAEIDRHFAEALELHGSALDAYLEELRSRDSELAAAVEDLVQAAERRDPRLGKGACLEGPIWEELAGPAGERPSAVGETVGTYRIVGELGRGGMSVVYLAERVDRLFQHRVALKFLSLGAADEEGLRRFEQERQILATLNHPGIARLLDGRVDPHGRPYIVMELVDGRTIDRFCDEEELDVDERLDLFAGVARAVEYAHRNLVVHRDLKPSNILVTRDGQVKLLDFGIAKLLEPGAAGGFAAPPTRTAVRVLTPEYASPEQVRGEPVTTASDVYQLGVLLYELLTGRRPFSLTKATPSEMERAICKAEPLRPSVAVTRPNPNAGVPRRGPSAALARRLKGDLDNIILKSLEKEPDRRYASVAELREDLWRYRSGLPVRARRPTVNYRARKFVRRHRIGVAVAALLIALGIGYGATVSFQARRIAAEAARTERVKDFLTSLFTRASPGVSQGTELTALELVEEGARRVATELGDEPELRAELMTVLGEVLGTLGRYELAAEQLGPALEIRRRVLGDSHAEVARTAKALGYSLHHQGRYHEAEEPLREALEIRRRLFGERSRQVALTLDELGDLFHSRGEFEEAERLLRHALAVPVEVTGEVDRAVAQHHLANVRRDRGAFGEAEGLYRRSLVVLEERLGPMDPVAALTRSELALLLVQTGRVEEAEALLEENFLVYERLYPGGHAMVGTTFRNLGLLRLRQGRPGEARQALQHSLAIYGRMLPERNALIPRVQRYLAQAALALGEVETAAALAEEALTRLRGLGLTEHPAVADALEVLGLARLAQDRPADAFSLLAESLAVRMRSSIDSDPRLEATRARLERARASAEAQVVSAVP